MNPQQQGIMYWHNPNIAQQPAQYHSYYPAFTASEPSQSSTPPIDTQPTFSINQSAIRNGSKKRRACNECKQQKLRCDLSTLIQPAGETCSRCKRLGLDCRIDRSFRRERKRKRSDELEREVDSLRRELSKRSDSIQGGDVGLPRQYDNVGSDTGSTSSMGNFQRTSEVLSTTVPNMTSPESVQAFDPRATTTMAYNEPAYNGSESGEADTDPTTFTEQKTLVLGNIRLTIDEIDELFAEYFSNYHSFFPVLDPGKTPAQYFESSPLLFWAVISVAARRYTRDSTLLIRLAPCVTSLIWTTLQSVPHSQKVVQSLALLCTWPFPTSSTTADVSYLWAGSMMNISIQMGLHRPANPQDFTNLQVQLEDVELSERVRTWAACNIAAESVSVGIGLAAPAQYDWALISGPRFGSASMRLDPDLELRSRVEMFRDKVTKSLASNASDPIGLLPTNERLSLYRVFMKELEGIEGSVTDVSCVNRFSILAARLHLQSFYLFDEPSTDAYTERILMLYFTSLSLVQEMVDAEIAHKRILPYVPFSTYQTVVAASFIILKIMKNDYFSSFADLEIGTRLFHTSVNAIKRMSVANNDLPSRLADVLAFLWTDMTGIISGPGKEGLQLGIRSRMSMSVVYDSLWRWKAQFRARVTDANAFQEEMQDEHCFDQPVVAGALNCASQYAVVQTRSDAFDGFDLPLEHTDYAYIC